MATFITIVNCIKVVGKVTKTIRVNADNAQMAMKLAKNIAEQSPNIVKAAVTLVRAIK